MNCTTPTGRPRPSMRSARPKAAVDLPLPGPVWTISRPFSIVFAGDFGVLHRLALCHLGTMALGFGRSVRLTWLPFTIIGRPATMKKRAPRAPRDAD